MTSTETIIISSLITIATNAIVILVSSSNLFLLLKNVLPAYFTEKGKNIATREDIAGITREVEKVKEEFTAKSEELRTDLLYFNQVRSSIKTEERNAIVNCYEKYHLWRTTITEISFADLKSPEAAIEKIADIEALYQQVSLAESKMLLYIGKDAYATIFAHLRGLTKSLELYVIEQCLDYASEFYRHNSKAVETPASDSAGTSKLQEKHYKNKVKIMKEATSEIHSQYSAIEKEEEVWQAESLRKLTELSSLVVPKG
jgi:hypothetical protein